MSESIRKMKYSTVQDVFLGCHLSKSDFVTLGVYSMPRQVKDQGQDTAKMSVHPSDKKWEIFFKILFLNIYRILT